MSRIISVSRRTDIPAFYAEWFGRRLDEGFAGWENPFGGQRYIVSLKPQDVAAFVFWSKNYRPFLPALERVKSMGFASLLNYTITGLPQEYECDVVPTDDAIDSLAAVSEILSPDHINWRYDPIVISSATPVEYHEKRFETLCERLQGKVTRCYFSFAIMYGKVARNFKQFETQHKLSVHDLLKEDRILLTHKLSIIAKEHGIVMYTCCGDYLIDGLIKKAHCIDGDIISRLCGDQPHHRAKPTRKECGCVESTDIGKYDSCPHGCVYCYANVNKQRAADVYCAHDPETAFLGYTKSQSDQFLHDCRSRAAKTKLSVPGKQLKLFG